MTTSHRFVSIQPKRIMGYIDFKDRFLDFIRTQYSDLVEQVFGDDGSFGSLIGMAEHAPTGNDRFQLSSTSIRGSDGFGHLLQPDAELAGQDVGFQFPNTAATTYYVAQHYAERPRGIQINPRTGYPEFLEFEETIGYRADPDLVTDNGSTITFNVDSVAKIFSPADDSLDQTGRQVLVWKKTPGRTALTEAVAVEQLTITYSGGNNVVTSTGLFGQSSGAVSEVESEYYVLLLGATLSLQDLSAETEFHFIGTITGAGTGMTPSFSTTGQNNLGPIAADINVISATHHGNRKIYVSADNSDVDETQIEVHGRPDAASPLVFSVDEDGDTYALGNLDVDGVATLASMSMINSTGDSAIGDAEADTHTFKGLVEFRNNGSTLVAQVTTAGRAGFGGAADATAFLKAYGDGIITQTLDIGSALNTSGDAAGALTARFEMGQINAFSNYNLIGEFSRDNTTFYRAYTFNTTASNIGLVLVHNVAWNQGTSMWDPDDTGVDAMKYAFLGEQWLFQHKANTSITGSFADTAWTGGGGGNNRVFEYSQTAGGFVAIGSNLVVDLDATVAGDLTVTTNLDVTGTSTFASDVTLTGSSQLDVGGDAIIGGSMDAGASSSVTGDLTVSGKLGLGGSTREMNSGSIPGSGFAINTEFDTLWKVSGTAADYSDSVLQSAILGGTEQAKNYSGYDESLWGYNFKESPAIAQAIILDGAPPTYQRNYGFAASITKNSTGDYTVGFNISVSIGSITSKLVQVTPLGTTPLLVCANPSGTTVNVKFVNSSGTATDTDFFIQVWNIDA